jgi:hypothetical protein
LLRRVEADGQRNGWLRRILFPARAGGVDVEVVVASRAWPDPRSRSVGAGRVNGWASARKLEHAVPIDQGGYLIACESEPERVPSKVGILVDSSCPTGLPSSDSVHLSNHLSPDMQVKKETAALHIIDQRSKNSTKKKTTHPISQRFLPSMNVF